MSKIPLATPRPGTPEAEALAKRKRLKKDTIVAFVTLTVIAAIVGLLIFLSIKDNADPNKPLHILSDAFGVSGILGICIFGLGYVSSRGAFDLLSYSVKLIFLNAFRPKYRQESFPKSFYEYKVRKDSLERKAPYMMLFVALAYLTIGIIFLIVYYSQI